MPLWINDVLRFLGLSRDSARPNIGALLMLGGLVLLAMGYTPDEMGGWLTAAETMAGKAAEFAMKADNLIGVALMALGYRVATKSTA